MGLGRILVGSSPLARGLQLTGETAHDHAGIIPARAGFTGGDRAPGGGGADHPRSRGVYPQSPPYPQHYPGSSPLARGLHGEELLECHQPRIIPARAGFTSTATSAPPADHPRSRGVYHFQRSRASSSHGSSPLARGLRAPSQGAASGIGIIPARAGFTCVAAHCVCAVRDHPRSRGVYAYAAVDGMVRKGSSPLARGLRMLARPHGPTPGIIPARAGFTVRMASRQAGRKDHPRSRGVYVANIVEQARMGGSSPLARGLRGRCRGSGVLVRDHPRSRGVYSSSLMASMTSAGSSPLARGLLRPGNAGGDPGRIIPARAGFTLLRPPLVSASTDHPRSRGVYRGPSRHPPRLLRIIPARAGFTAAGPLRSMDGEDHPRSRGVYESELLRGGGQSGSSPLARGLR